MNCNPSAFVDFLKPHGTPAAEPTPHADHDVRRLMNMALGRMGWAPSHLQHFTLSFLAHLPENHPSRVEAGRLIEAQLDFEEQWPAGTARTLIDSRANLAAQLLSLMPGGPPPSVVAHVRCWAGIDAAAESGQNLLRAAAGGATNG